MKPISRWWKSLFSRDSGACDALTPCSRRSMDELPRRFGEAEGPAECVMKPIRLEETRMSGLDDYPIDPNVSLPSKTPNRQHYLHNAGSHRSIRWYRVIVQGARRVHRGAPGEDHGRSNHGARSWVCPLEDRGRVRNCCI